MFIFFSFVFLGSSVFCSSSSSSSSTTSSSPLPCGTPNDKEQIVNLTFAPNEKLIFNAPFDMDFMDHFSIQHSSWRRVAYRVNVTARFKIVLPRRQGILGEDTISEKVSIGFKAFNFDDKNFQNDTIEIEWVNIPNDAPLDAGEECFEEWFEIPSKKKTLKIEYNP